MIESSTPSKFAKWKRPLIGGLLSALPAILFGLIVTVEPEVPSNFADFIFLTLMGIFTSFLLIFRTLFAETHETLAILLTILFWFLSGGLIARLIKNNIVGVVGWIVLQVTLFLIGGALCIFCQ